jgi:hypothetical protein
MEVIWHLNKYVIESKKWSQPYNNKKFSVQLKNFKLFISQFRFKNYHFIFYNIKLGTKKFNVI